MQSEGEKKRLSLPGGLARVSIFSLTTSASTNLDESFASRQTFYKMSCHDLFSNSEIKKDEETLLSSL